MATATQSYAFLEPSPPGESEDELGRLGHYRVIRQLGQGGMGFVFEAEDTRLKRRVALKVMNQKVAATTGARTRFVTEARAMAAIRHDNVATIFEVGQRGQTPFMAMEMLSGETFEQFNARVKSGNAEALNYESIIRYAQQICHGLTAAHERGIVHRDIKPANLWIESQLDRVKILDFGLALSQTPIDSLAGRGSVIGTPGYMSPEQTRSEPLDDRSDLYSLGVVLFELCTSQLPIRSKSIHDQLISILIHKPDRVEDVNSAIPAPLAQTIAKLLRKEPRSRFRSAAELATHLDAVRVKCERTSEVALTIGKLKSTLESVGTTDSELSSPDVLRSDNPLAADDSNFGSILDDIAMPASADALGNSSGSMAASPSSIGLPGPRQATHRPTPKPASTSNSTSGLNSYLPVVIIVGLLLLALPIMTFAFTGFGRSNENVMIRPSAYVEETQTPPSQPQQTSSPPNPAPQPAPNNPPPKVATQPDPVAEPATVAVAPPPATPDVSVSMPEPTPQPVDPPTADPVPEASPTPQPVRLPMRVESISTATPRGADATVSRSSNDTAGDALAISVQTRGNVSTRESYLRFDLKELEQELSKVQNAQLVLTPVLDERPVGATLTLHAIAMDMLWPESEITWERSFSKDDLSGLEEVGSMTVEPDPSGALNVEIKSERLAEFIRDMKGETVTLVLSGKHGNEQLRFVSRDKSPEDAPKLQLAIQGE